MSTVLEELLVAITKADEEARVRALDALRGKVETLMTGEQVRTRYSLSESTFHRLMKAYPAMNVIVGARGCSRRFTEASVRAALAAYRHKDSERAA